MIALNIKGYGQSATPIFIGLQPGITVEPFYEEGEFDVDLAMVVFEASVGRRMNIKISPRSTAFATLRLINLNLFLEDTCLFVFVKV